MAAQNLDAVIAPTNGPAWVTDPVNGDLGGDFSTFIGGRWDEPTLIALAFAFEQATRVRVPPDFIPTIGDDASASRRHSSRQKQSWSREAEGGSPRPKRPREDAAAAVARHTPRGARVNASARHHVFTSPGVARATSRTAS